MTKDELIARLQELGEQLNRDVSLTGTKEELALRVAELEEELDDTDETAGQDTPLSRENVLTGHENEVVSAHLTAHRMSWWLTFPCTRVSFHRRGQWQHRTGYRNQPQRLPLLHSGQATFCHFGCHTGRDTERRSRQHKCHRFIPRGVKCIGMQRHQCHYRDQFSRIMNHGIRLR